MERCDFIVSYSQFNNRSKLTLYMMCDFYTIFYYKFIHGNKSKDEHYWQHHYMDRSVESWKGFTFEQLCLRHLDHIKHCLVISGVATVITFITPYGVVQGANFGIVHLAE